MPVEQPDGWDRADIAALVLSGVAAVTDGDHGWHGASAAEALLPGLAGPARSGVLSARSDRALRSVASLPGLRTAADALYRYGRLPVGDGELARLPTREAVSRWLGIDPTPDWLAGWRQRDPKQAGNWNLWQRVDAPRPIARDQPVHKLYVSPLPADLPDALRALAETAAEVGVPVIKVASDVHAAHRPDKLVAYAVDAGQLDALASRLQPRLSGLLAHGVPFTAERTDDGLLSWAADPVPEPDTERRTSWREQVTAVLGDGLSRWPGLGVDGAVTAARAWAWVNDIDPRTWAPRAAA